MRRKRSLSASAWRSRARAESSGPAAMLAAHSSLCRKARRDGCHSIAGRCSLTPWRDSCVGGGASERRSAGRAVGRSGACGTAGRRAAGRRPSVPSRSPAFAMQALAMNAMHAVSAARLSAPRPASKTFSARYRHRRQLASALRADSPALPPPAALLRAPPCAACPSPLRCAAQRPGPWLLSTPLHRPRT